MNESIKNYHDGFKNLLDSIVVTSLEKDVPFFSGVGAACDLIKKRTDAGSKVIFIGNGGSAAICSHMAIDYWKNGGMKATAFNDAALLTCLSNDFGYDYVFEKPVRVFAEEGDVLFAVSSSGKSKNILNAVKAAKEKKCVILTLSGFDAGNPLRKEGVWNFYVPSSNYGPVEVAHQYICHAILDVIIASKGRL